MRELRGFLIALVVILVVNVVAPAQTTPQPQYPKITYKDVPQQLTCTLTPQGAVCAAAAGAPNVTTAAILSENIDLAQAAKAGDSIIWNILAKSVIKIESCADASCATPKTEWP